MSPRLPSRVVLEAPLPLRAQRCVIEPDALYVGATTLTWRSSASMLSLASSWESQPVPRHMSRPPGSPREPLPRGTLPRMAGVRSYVGGAAVT